MTSLAHVQLQASLSKITFTVPVTPRGWARARRKGNVYFVDQETAAFKRAVTAFAAEAMRHSVLLEGPVAMTVISIMPVPASWPRKKTEAALRGEVRPMTKPDADNLAKGVADSLNLVVYRDDAQIVSLRSEKFYGARPEVQVAVSEVGS